MALPIKETPILKGEDAERFTERMKNAKKNPVSQEEYDKAFKIYKELRKNPKTSDNY